jgi:hypothetical protein
MISMNLLDCEIGSRLSRPSAVPAEMSFERLGILVNTEPSAREDVAGSLTLGWREGGVDAFRASLTGIVGRFVKIELLDGECLDVRVADIRTSKDGACHLVCHRRDGGAPKGRHAHPAVIPNKLLIPVTEASRILLG